MTPANGVPVDGFDTDRRDRLSAWLERAQAEHARAARATTFGIVAGVLLAITCALVAVGVATGYGL